jgi:hypothetical protein
MEASYSITSVTTMALISLMETAESETQRSNFHVDFTDHWSDDDIPNKTAPLIYSYPASSDGNPCSCESFTRCSKYGGIVFDYFSHNNGVDRFNVDSRIGNSFNFQL